MPTPTIKLSTLKKILRLKFESRCSNRQIGQTLSISPSVVFRYVKQAVELGIDQWPLPKAWDDSTLSGDFLKTTVTTKQHLLPDWCYVHNQLQAKAVTLQKLWQAYAKQNPKSHYTYNHFCRLYKRWLNERNIMIDEYKAGEKLFTSYGGEVLNIANPETGELYAAHIFIGFMEASEYVYIEATWLPNLENWLAFHVRCFENFGGTPKIVISDCLKKGKAVAYKKDPNLDLTYQRMLSFFGVKQNCAKSYTLKEKAKLKSVKKHVERQVLNKLKNEFFSSLSELNKQLILLSVEFNQRPLPELTTSRQETFQNIDKPALNPLPKQEYQYTLVKKVKVHFDYHVEFNKHYYSAPFQLFEQELELHANNSTIELYLNQKIIANHPRKYHYGYTTDANHMPESNDKNAKWTPQRFLKWAAMSGEHTVNFTRQILYSKEHPAQSYRYLMGLMNLHKTCGHKQLNQVCGKALEEGIYKLRDVRKLLNAPIKH